MTANEKSPTVATVTPQSPVVQGGSPVEVQALEHLFRGLVEPMVRSQETAELEKTKRTQIEASTVRAFLKYCFWLVAIILLISGAALWLGKDALTEKIIIAVISFIGGFGVAKGVKSEKV